MEDASQTYFTLASSMGPGSQEGEQLIWRKKGVCVFVGGSFYSRVGILTDICLSVV